MTTQVTDAEFMDAVVAIVAENPTHIYNQHDLLSDPPSKSRCAYVFDGKADCLIGQALVRAGVPVEELDFHEIHCSGSLTADSFLTQFGISEPVRKWAGQIQAEQDSGKPWARALAYADHPATGGRPLVNRQHLVAV